ncbi:hypothetical protein BD410DRAFT_1543 [Rickenella mellea]|uniref:Uncharacterized protein n=1 Tax=Rickenella mellea TaxID=50990 RepID=A0A4R5XDC7_9AGAM|nr:hypothetical protein BD410DRAFT_1543 [Rickenella mellea]
MNKTAPATLTKAMMLRCFVKASMEATLGQNAENVEAVFTAIRIIELFLEAKQSKRSDDELRQKMPPTFPPPSRFDGGQFSRCNQYTAKSQLMGKFFDERASTEDKREATRQNTSRRLSHRSYERMDERADSPMPARHISQSQYSYPHNGSARYLSE